MKPLALDLCCGAGGWTDGLRAAGFEVIGVDVVRRPDYAGDHFIQADVRDVEAVVAAIRRIAAGRPILAIVRAPPCQRFSLARAGRVADPPTEADLDILRACIEVGDAFPEALFKLTENVRGALRWFSPILGAPSLRHGPYYIWGNVPAFLTERAGLNKGINGSSSRKAQRDGKQSHRHRDPWLRSKMPIELTRPMAFAMASAIQADNGCTKCQSGINHSTHYRESETEPTGRRHTAPGPGMTPEQLKAAGYEDSPTRALGEAPAQGAGPTSRELGGNESSTPEGGGA